MAVGWCHSEAERTLHSLLSYNLSGSKSFFHFKQFVSDFIGIDFVLCDERVRLTNVEREAPFPA